MAARSCRQLEQEVLRSSGTRALCRSTHRLWVSSRSGQCSSSFWLTTVYGPVDDGLKDSFLAELIHSAPPLGEPWMLAGDFNIIYEARDKSNLNLNRRIMGMFRRAIDTAGLKEIKCKNRRFTWSNERQDPTLVSIDKIFCNVEWESLFPSLMLMAASTACSDHCPLVLADTTAPPRRATFKFEAFWPRFPRFRETLERAWQRPVASACPIARLNTKLKRAAFDLKIWARSLFSDAKVQLHLAAEVVLRLDIAQEARRLSPAEFCLRKQLKLRIIGLAAIERARKRQASRVSWLRAGDAKTAFFQAKINSRRRKNHIHSLQIEAGWPLRTATRPPLLTITSFSCSAQGGHAPARSTGTPSCCFRLEVLESTTRSQKLKFGRRSRHPPLRRHLDLTASRAHSTNHAGA